MKYYKVMCERAHIGSGKDAYINFYYKADNILQAMDKAKRQRGTKHTKLPPLCVEVTKEEYRKNINVSAYVRAGAREK